MTYSIYISSYLYLYQTSDKGIKDINKDIYIVTISIRSICARATSIGMTCAVNTWITYSNVGTIYTRGIYARNAFIWGSEPKALTKSKITLAG